MCTCSEWQSFKIMSAAVSNIFWISSQLPRLNISANMWFCGRWGQRLRMLCGKIIKRRLLSVDWVEFDVQWESLSREMWRWIKDFLENISPKMQPQIKYWDILEKCSFLSGIILSKLLPAKTIINDRNRFLCWKQKPSIKLSWLRITTLLSNTTTEDCRNEKNEIICRYIFCCKKILKITEKSNHFPLN